MSSLLPILNNIQLPPLDGSGAIPLLVRREKAGAYLDLIHSRHFSFLGIFIAWKVFDFIFDPIHLLFINRLHPGAAYQ